MVTGNRIRYRDAGVNIDEAERAVGAIKKMAERTFSSNVLTQIGAFGASYALAGWKERVLVSSEDGVASRLKNAFLTGGNDTVGRGLSRHCVRGTSGQCATPLFLQ